MKNTRTSSLQTKDDIEIDRQIMFNFIKDLAENGLRCDLNPTLQKLNDPQAVVLQMYEYLRRQDQHIRDAAKSCLGKVKESRESLSEIKDPVI